MSSKIYDGTARTPADITAALVISKGVHYERERLKDLTTWAWELEPRLRDYTGIRHAPELVGLRKGQLVVIGVLDIPRNKKKGWVWVCRCDCGSYVGRRHKALFNPDNAGDTCLSCKNTVHLKARAANAHPRSLRKAAAHAWWLANQPPK